MKIYFDINRINEIRENYRKISNLFLLKEQNEMCLFLLEIENNGYCEIELYNNIYSILNNVSQRYNESKQYKSSTKQKNDRQDTSCDNSVNIQILDLIRLQFATKYFAEQNSKIMMKSEVNESENNSIVW